MQGSSPSHPFAFELEHRLSILSEVDKCMIQIQG